MNLSTLSKIVFERFFLCGILKHRMMHFTAFLLLVNIEGREKERTHQGKYNITMYFSGL